MSSVWKSLLKLVISSLIIWGVMVLVFSDKISIPNTNPKDEETTTLPADAVFKDGTYQGVGSGLNGDITLEVTIVDGKISTIKVLDHAETEDISDPAFDQIPAAIIAGNSIEVDAVSGATYTSQGIVEAVKNALLESIEK